MGRAAMRILPLVAAVLLTACGGYRWVGVDGGAGPGGATSLVVPTFVNESAEPFLSEKVTAAMRERLLAGGVNVAASGGARLNGRILDFQDEVLAFDGAGNASHRRLVVVVRLELIEAGETVWQRARQVSSAVYPVTGDPTRNRDAKDRAIEDAAFSLGEQVLLGLGTRD